MGERRDFDALYRRHAPNAFRRAARMLGDAADAREIVHDVFVSLCERPEQFEERSSLSTFLYRAVTNACLNRIRDRGNRQRILRHLPPMSVGGYVHDDPERTAQLRSVLEQMPEPLAQVAVYYYLDELSHADIARILGCSSRHVGDLVARLHRWAESEEAMACDA